MPCRIICQNNSRKVQASVTYRAEEISEKMHLAFGVPSPSIFDEFKKVVKSIIKHGYTIHQRKVEVSKMNREKIKVWVVPAASANRIIYIVYVMYSPPQIIHENQKLL